MFTLRPALPRKEKRENESMNKNTSAIAPAYAKELLAKQINIGIAATEKEKQEIYRFRYQIYAEEIGFKLVAADHGNKLLADELDDWGSLLYAKLGKELIGTARVNMGRLTDFPADLVEAFFMKRFEKFYEEKNGQNHYNFGFASKGMIAPAYRSSPVHNLLIGKIYELYCNKNVQFAFVDCNFHLIPFHEHYGSRRLGKNILDPNLGPMASFVLLVDDVRHLRAVGSPLFHLAVKRKALNRQSVEWFYKEFAGTLNSTVNSQLVSGAELWNLLCGRLGHKPNQYISVLHGLSEAQARKFLHGCGVIVQCDAGDYITSRDDVSQELNILLSGKVQSLQPRNILPGQHCGEIGLVNRAKHSGSIFAATDAEILVLSFHYFRKFHKAYPAIANKVIRSLTRDIKIT
ncbi:MAG TPA: cyclic nucleotide-binding domain-containing protein [Methylomusa anaerophila]|uniref:Cyclic nucleotide-binding domain protein n=1 Tax=Methylomusa anaerophila TaxID=1930071 RepID=A0A348AH09_9FIRM|nr:cyclic nucleotide-binding domain-containing protein [Methylomusa anaerophila]BBB90357.1 cyclic nucleotide-binding domain protein [Methylomusa anaerophila]HML89297.1 cyclic nucleotide-binding domain-containing protein [Methylomusa anaerophila]